MKIAIVTLATNNYKKFLFPLVESIKTHFIPDAHKDFYLFSDEKLDWFDSSITWEKITHEQWPYITLKRFEFISKQLHNLMSYDYVFYFDCDMEFVDTVKSLDCDLKKYYAVAHPANILNKNFWTGETNNKSTAYIPNRHNCVYVQGCLWGARGHSIKYMIDTLKKNIDDDLQNGIIAIWHDESHLNKFMVDHRDECSILSHSLAYPEFLSLPINKVVIHKEKTLSEYPRFSGSTPFKKNT